jgi:malonate-semialdehyde dehydrogenase (acetylating)/methylmalonate-semialdehyde dehydrogenase
MSQFPFAARGYEFTPYVHCQNWIGGRWAAAASGESIAVENPRHALEMGRVAWSDERDIDAAVQAAAAALPAWRDTPLKERAQVLFRVKQLMEAHLDELCWLLSHENGKTFDEARGSVLKGIECVEFGASLTNMAAGQQMDVSRGINCRVSYEPEGVCAGIVPFNFPTMVPLWMLPQALVGGNTFVLKPSEQVPYGAMRLAELFQQAGLPDGVLNIVNGGKATVEAICDHPGIRAVGFVGSRALAG